MSIPFKRSSTSTSGVACDVEHTLTEKFCGVILIVQLLTFEKIEPKTLDEQEAGGHSPS